VVGKDIQDEQKLKFRSFGSSRQVKA